MCLPPVVFRGTTTGFKGGPTCPLDLLVYNGMLSKTSTEFNGVSLSLRGDLVGLFDLSDGFSIHDFRFCI